MHMHTYAGRVRTKVNGVNSYVNYRDMEIILSKSDWNKTILHFLSDVQSEDIHNENQGRLLEENEEYNRMGRGEADVGLVTKVQVYKTLKLAFSWTHSFVTEYVNKYIYIYIIYRNANLPVHVQLYTTWCKSHTSDDVYLNSIT